MGLTLALCACAGAPRPNAALESAHAAVQAAESDPNVSKYAALDLEAAKKDLAIADDAALHHKDDAIAQPAYLAAQNARLAQMHAAAKADDARVAAGQAERDQIMLAARSRDLQNAQAARLSKHLESAGYQVDHFLVHRGLTSGRGQGLRVNYIIIHAYS